MLILFLSFLLSFFDETVLMLGVMIESCNKSKLNKKNMTFSVQKDEIFTFNNYNCIPLLN